MKRSIFTSFVYVSISIGAPHTKHLQRLPIPEDPMLSVLRQPLNNAVSDKYTFQSLPQDVVKLISDYLPFWEPVYTNHGSLSLTKCGLISIIGLIGDLGMSLKIRSAVNSGLLQPLSWYILFAAIKLSLLGTVARKSVLLKHPGTISQIRKVPDSDTFVSHSESGMKNGTNTKKIMLYKTILFNSNSGKAIRRVPYNYFLSLPECPNQWNELSKSEAFSPTVRKNDVTYAIKPDDTTMVLGYHDGTVQTLKLSTDTAVIEAWKRS